MMRANGRNGIGRMKGTIGVMAGLVMWGGAMLAIADEGHLGKGMILAADRASVTMVMESGERLTLALSGATHVTDDLGNPFPAVGLGPGDYVLEDCVGLGDGRMLARRITLLRPAWRDMGSPEN